jgi:preprotein translocase subunit SecA
MGMMDTLGLDEDTPIDAKILSGAVENAQRSVESRNFRMRKNVLEYDDVMNTQREVIYAQRNKVLQGEDLKDNILSFLRQVVDTNVSTALAPFGGTADEEGLAAVLAHFEGIYFPKGAYTAPEKRDVQSISDSIYNLAAEFYAKKEAAVGENIMRELERVVMLRAVDEYWMDNIDAMDDLRQGIGLRAYAQHDPVVAFKQEGFQIFEAMVAAIREETVRRMFLMEVRKDQEVKRKKVARETGTPPLSGSETGDKTQITAAITAVAAVSLTFRFILSPFRKPNNKYRFTTKNYTSIPA